MSERKVKQQRKAAAAAEAKQPVMIDRQKLITDRAQMQELYDMGMADLERKRADCNAMRGVLQYLDRLIESAVPKAAPPPADPGTGKS